VRRVPLVIGAVTLLTLLSGCGLPADSSPRNIDLSQKPIGLQPLPPPPAASGEADLLGPRVWYFEDDEGGLTLRAVSRDVDQNYEDLLDVLLSGPNAAEQSEGIINQIPTGTRLLNLAPPDEIGTMAIDLSEDFLTQQGAAVGNALGQIVLTATEDEAVRRVVVTVAGESYPWVVGDNFVDEGTGISREMFQYLNPTEYTEPGVPPPTSPTTRPPAPTTTRPRPPGVD